VEQHQRVISWEKKWIQNWLYYWWTITTSSHYTSSL
jgi:hypothetical protein